MKCFACCAEKDMTVETVYPYNEECDHLTQEIPIPQLLTIECQGEQDLPNGGWDFRMAVMCHECWHRLSATRGIDMWIGQACWESLKPVIPFDRLPPARDFLPVEDRQKEADHEKWKAENYSPLPSDESKQPVSEIA